MIASNLKEVVWSSSYRLFDLAFASIGMSSKPDFVTVELKQNCLK